MSTTPNYKGRFLQGIDTNTKVGDKIEPGLPNITGNINYILGAGAVDIGQTWGNGPFRTSLKYYRVKYGDDDGAAYGVSFNAALSNPIYGKSTTVQPPSVIVKYIIKAE